MGTIYKSEFQRRLRGKSIGDARTDITKKSMDRLVERLEKRAPKSKIAADLLKKVEKEQKLLRGQGTRGVKKFIANQLISKASGEILSERERKKVYERLGWSYAQKKDFEKKFIESEAPRSGSAVAEKARVERVRRNIATGRVAEDLMKNRGAGELGRKARKEEILRKVYTEEGEGGVKVTASRLGIQVPGQRDAQAADNYPGNRPAGVGIDPGSLHKDAGAPSSHAQADNYPGTSQNVQNIFSGPKNQKPGLGGAPPKTPFKGFRDIFRKAG